MGIIINDKKKCIQKTKKSLCILVYEVGLWLGDGFLVS